MKIELSEASKSQISEYIKTDGLNDQMVATLYEYLLSLRVSELSKDTYLHKLKNFGVWLLNHDINSFQEAKNSDINRFLEKYEKNTTKNSHSILQHISVHVTTATTKRKPSFFSFFCFKHI
jgi:site-specific recombinase XerD